MSIPGQTAIPVADVNPTRGACPWCGRPGRVQREIEPGRFEMRGEKEKKSRVQVRAARAVWVCDNRAKRIDRDVALTSARRKLARAELSPHASAEHVIGLRQLVDELEASEPR